jgi:hypothetical protein
VTEVWVGEQDLLGRLENRWTSANLRVLLADKLTPRGDKMWLDAVASLSVVRCRYDPERRAYLYTLR